MHATTELAFGLYCFTCFSLHPTAEQEVETGCGSTCCTVVLVIMSVLLSVIFFPFSMLLIIKVSRPAVLVPSPPPEVFLRLSPASVVWSHYKVLGEPWGRG